MTVARSPLMALALCAAVAGFTSAQSSSDPQIPPTGSGAPARALTARAIGALIEPMNNATVTGTVTMTPGHDPGTTLVTVSLVGAAPGKYHWELHVGSCDSPGALLGNRSQYRPITVDADGIEAIGETMPFDPPSGGSYAVIIHQGADRNNAGNIIACGTLLETGV
jgi:hypothetical protein